MGHAPESSVVPRSRPNHRARSLGIDSIVVAVCVALAAALTVAAAMGRQTLPGFDPDTRALTSEGLPTLTPDGLPTLTPDGLPTLTPDGLPTLTPDGLPTLTPDGLPSVLPIGDPAVSFDGPVSRVLGTEALTLISYDWPTELPGWRIEFVEDDSPVAGYTWSREERIEVFVRPGADAHDLARILAHELGHAVDVTLNRPEHRAEWLSGRGIAADTPWWPSSGAADFRTGAGDFAEVFAAWQIGNADFRSEVGPVPTASDLDRVARLATRD